jgi:hypothetical protein
MAIDEEEVKTLVRAECGAPSVSEVGDDILDAAYESACRDINRRVVNVEPAVGEIETEENVQEYDIPEDCLYVRKLYWGPAVSTVPPTSRLLRTPYTFSAIEIGEELKNSRQQRIDKLTFQWQVISTDEGRKLVLGDIPDVGGDIIKFIYVRASSSDALMPDSLVDAIKEFMKWQVFRVRFAFWTTNEAITASAELRMQRAEQFNTLADKSEKRYNEIMKSYMGA